MIAQETFTLAKSVAIPKLGLGTWLVDDGAVSGLVVVTNLDLVSCSGQDGDLNRCGGWLGAMAQADDDDPQVTPPTGDLETARHLGRRVADVAGRLWKREMAA